MIKSSEFVRFAALIGVLVAIASHQRMLHNCQELPGKSTISYYDTSRLLDCELATNGAPALKQFCLYQASVGAQIEGGGGAPLGVNNRYKFRLLPGQDGASSRPLVRNSRMSVSSSLANLGAPRGQSEVFNRMLLNGANEDADSFNVLDSNDRSMWPTQMSDGMSLSRWQPMRGKRFTN